MIRDKKYRSIESFEIPNYNTGKDGLISVGEIFDFVEHLKYGDTRKTILVNNVTKVSLNLTDEVFEHYFEEVK